MTLYRKIEKKLISFKSITYIDNKKFKYNEQLDSLFTAKKELNDEIIILFSDIIYDFKVLEKSLIGSVLAFFVDDSNFENIINLQIYIYHATLIFLVETLRLRTYLTIF